MSQNVQTTPPPSKVPAEVSNRVTVGLTSRVLARPDVASLVFCLAIGFLNGYLVMRTGIPSFLITLGTFFVLQGANLGVTKLVTGSVSTPDINAINGFGSLTKVFASSIKIGGVTIWTSVLWWLAFVALSAWILQRTKIGNWIFAVGGNAASA